MFSCIHVNLITSSRANPNVFQEIPKDKVLPEAQKMETVLATKGPQGETIATRVHEVKDKTIVVDLNHLLADKTLNFDVKVMNITAAEARQTPGSCIASKQKSPVWESQPGHNNTSSSKISLEPLFCPLD
jgi:FKBP-type peptidyl-prolyl cis-trans isomerase 2